MRILLDRPAPGRLRELIDRTAPDWAEVSDLERGDPGFAAHLAEAEVVLHVLDPITAADVRAAPRLRLVQKFGSGVNTIDLDAAREAGVAVTNMPGANAPAVAEHTVGLILAALRNLPTLHAHTVDGTAWPGGAHAAAPGGELGGRQVGLVGYGAIATRVERAVVALGATTVHHARDTTRPGWVPLDDLLASSDVVSLHLPLDATTDGLLDARRLARLAPGALLVNTSRGQLVDHDALLERLAAGALAGACLDVFPDEPMPADHPLLHTPGVIATPHVAWLTDETLARCWERALDNCTRLRDGAPLADRVV